MSAVGSLIAALLMFVGIAAVGSRLRTLLRLPVSPALRLPVEFTLGIWTVGTGVLTLGLAGRLTALPLLTTAALLAIGGRYRGLGVRLVTALPAASTSALLLPVALAPPFFYDALVYHLGLPAQALLDGRLGAHPENLFATFPPLAQLLYLLPLAIGLDRVPAVLHLLSCAAAATAVRGLTLRLGASTMLATLAGASLVLLRPIGLVAGFPAAEGFMLTATTAAAAIAVTGRRATSDAILVGGLAGIGLGARLQGLPWAVFVVTAIALRTRRPRVVASAIGACVLTSSPWWLKNLVLLGDPIAPIGWDRPGIETLWRDASSTVVAASSASGVTLTRLLTPLLENFGTLAPLILAALAAVAIGGPEHRRARLEILLLVAAGLVAWLASGTLARFLAPSAALLLAVAASPGPPSRPSTRLLGGVVITTLAAIGGLRIGQQTAALGGLDLLLAPADVTRERTIINDPSPAYAAARALPNDAHVLLVGEPRGFGFPRRELVTSQHDVSPLRGPLESDATIAEVHASLSRRFTHLLINWGELRRLEDAYPVAPFETPYGRRRFRELIESLGAPSVSVNGVDIYALADPKPTDPERGAVGPATQGPSHDRLEPSPRG